MSKATEETRKAVGEKVKDLTHFGHENGLCNVVLTYPDLYLECLDVEPHHFRNPLFAYIWTQIQRANDERLRDRSLPAPNLAAILNDKDPTFVALADDHGGFQALLRDFVKLQCKREHLTIFKDRVLAMARQRILMSGMIDLAETVERLADPRLPKVEEMQDAIEKTTTTLLRETLGRDPSGGLMCEESADEWIGSQVATVEEKGYVINFDVGMPAFDTLEILQPGRVHLSIIEKKGGKSTYGVTFGAAMAVGQRLASHVDRANGTAANIGDLITLRDPSGAPIVKRKVGYIDLEMGKERDVLPRMLANLSGVPAKVISSRRYLESAWDRERVHQAWEMIRESGMRFWHRSNYTTRWVRNAIREAVYKYGMEVFIVDYIRMPTGMDFKEGLAWEAAFTAMLKDAAEEFNVLIITFAQFGRDGQAGRVKKAGMGRPTSSELQGNIKILNYVDTIMIQDVHPDNPEWRRYWVDDSRISPKMHDRFLLVQPNYSLSQNLIVREELIVEPEVPERAPRKASSKGSGKTQGAGEPLPWDNLPPEGYEQARGYEDPGEYGDHGLPVYRPEMETTSETQYVSDELEVEHITTLHKELLAAAPAAPVPPDNF